MDGPSSNNEAQLLLRRDGLGTEDLTDRTIPFLQWGSRLSDWSAQISQPVTACRWSRMLIRAVKQLLVCLGLHRISSSFSLCSSHL